MRVGQALLLLPGNGIVEALPTTGEITSGFGLRRHPIYRRGHVHEGVDIANVRDTPVGATARGRVLQAGRGRGYGLMVEIDHGHGWTSRYAHLSCATVTVGAVVGAGTIIGRMGRSGVTTGVHLHYELRRYGVAVDPQPLLKAVTAQYASVTFQEAQRLMGD